MDNIIDVKNLTKTYKTRTNKSLISGLFNPNYNYSHAVHDVTFSVNEGESLAFLGPNGAGKTTTTKMMTGLIHPSNGSVQVLNYVPFERKKEFLKQIGLVMGNKAGLSWDLTSLQSFNLLQKIYEIEDSAYKKALNNLTELLDVKKHLDKQIRKLSLGERMKMELIGAILHNPKVLFLDEPTIGLDITSKKNIRHFLRDLQQNSNITLVLTSHDMDDIEKVCDRVLVINKGSKVFDGDITKLMADYNKQRYIKIIFDKVPDDLSALNYARLEKREGDNITFEISKDLTQKFISDVVSTGAVLDIDMVSVPLEDIIEDIFNKSNEVNSIA